MNESIDVKKGRSTEFYEQTQKISEYIARLPITAKQNNTLIEMLAENLTIAEKDAFRYGLSYGGAISAVMARLRGDMGEPTPEECESAARIVRTHEDEFLNNKE